jgi:hypothetical protein
MLTAYLDETGQEAKDWVFITGFLGNEDQWRDFAPKWKEGRGGKRSFHTKELRFKKERERRLLELLGPIPVSCGLEPIAGGIRVSDYEDLLGGNIVLEKLNCGYISALFPLVIQALRWIPANERLEIVFEEQERYGWLADFCLRQVSKLPIDFMWTKDGNPKLAKWSFVPKGSTSFTEPADYFAYAQLQYQRDKNSLKSQWCMPILKSADSVGIIGAVMTKNQARETVVEVLAMMKTNGIEIPNTIEQFERFRRLEREKLTAWRGYYRNVKSIQTSAEY